MTRLFKSFMGDRPAPIDAPFVRCLWSTSHLVATLTSVRLHTRRTLP